MVLCPSLLKTEDLIWNVCCYSTLQQFGLLPCCFDPLSCLHPRTSFRTVPDMEQSTVSTAPTGVPTEHSYGHCSPRNNYNIRPWPTLPLTASLPDVLERNRAERSETESRYNCRSSATPWMQCECVFNKSVGLSTHLSYSCEESCCCLLDYDTI